MLRPPGGVPGDGPVIDLNCDMGEGMDNDALIMPFISSANIACGYHAGDEASMRRTVDLALKYKVAIGAHPSYPDREHFGRVDMLASGLRIEDLPEMITDQLGLLRRICQEAGVSLHHVKPHGALYNRAAADPVVGLILCRAIHGFDPSLLIYGLSGSSMQAEAERCGMRFVREVFADRSYREDGSLTPRSEPGALIDDPTLALRQVLKMIREGSLATAGGNEIPMLAETVCIHGDGSHAVEFARLIHVECVRNGILVRMS